MPDPADIANDIVEVCQADAERRARGKSGPDPFDPEFDGFGCLDCDEPIPAPRLAMGKTRCVACQTLLEWKGKRGPL